MKRKDFLLSVAALGAAPFISQAEEKPIESSSRIPERGKISGRKPIIFRQSYRLAAGDKRIAGLTDDFIDDYSLRRMMHDIKKSSLLRKATIRHADGSLEYQCMLKVIQ